MLGISMTTTPAPSIFAAPVSSASLSRELLSQLINNHLILIITPHRVLISIIHSLTSLVFYVRLLVCNLAVLQHNAPNYTSITTHNYIVLLTPHAIHALYIML